MSTDPDKDMLALPAEAKLGGPKLPSAPPRYSDAGWLQWPDDEAYSFQFTRMLGAAREGASTISECFFAARLITPGDDESWYGRNRGISRSYRQSDPGIRIRLAAAKLDSTERIWRQRGRCV